MKIFIQKHAVLTFLLITFGWTWLFWFAAMPFRGQTLLLTAIVMIGGYGPAIGGILTFGLKNGMKPDFSLKKMAVMLAAALLIFGVISLRYLAGNIPNYDTLANDLTLSFPIVAAALVASLVGGWVISSAVAKNSSIHMRMASILPRRLPAGWAILSFTFYPVMILAAWGLAWLLGMPVEYPGLWGQPLFEVLPLYALTFSLTFLAQGGNEEPGWRGFMQPELQKRFSPLTAAVLVSLAWSLWHLPLFLNGFYAGSLVGGMIGGAVYRVLLAIFMAWFYNRSGGSIFLMVLLHTTFNMMVSYLPVSDIGLLILWVIVAAVVVVKDKMYRKLPAVS